jgi:hypothetical protein
VLNDFGVVGARVRDTGGALCRPLSVPVSQQEQETMA